MARKYIYDIKSKKIIEQEVEENQITNFPEIEIKILEDKFSNTTEALIECFEHFFNKITNITNVADLLNFNDYPHDLSELLKERTEIRMRIAELESEVESDG